MKKVFSLILIFCILLSFNVSALTLTFVNEKGETIKINDFFDTQGHWAHDIILKVAEYELVQGSNGNFMPDQPIKRGDLAIILDRMLSLKTTTYNMFYDLPNDAYYRDSILKCVAAGYINGISNNEVDPAGFATREQVAVIISRIFNLENNYSGGQTNFKDDNKISSWARNSVSAMNRLGYMNGTDTGYVNPQAYITRAELVTLLNNIANVYIPKSDRTAQGSEFSGNFPSNIVMSRSIQLVNSTVGRDIVMTYSGSSLSLTNTVVRGRILAIGRVSISIDESKVQRLELIDGKSSITGADMIEEIYVAPYASESTLDKIPNKLILESGVRIRINGTMYENETVRTKTYYAKDLQADIADEQGYIVGGPRISGATFSQDMDNTITVSNVRITEGENGVREIGVIWLEQDDNENAVNPTYKKNDGRKIYRSDKIDELIEFEVGEVDGTSAYRVYVKDKDGLLAYSNTMVFTEYEYNIKLNIYDNDYPEKLDVEVIFQGDNIPEINSVRVVYDKDDLYNEKHYETSLRLYSDPDSEYQPDPKKYKRYIATITSPIERIENETVVIPPTAFGYIITFRNNTLINRFPILTNAIPDDVSPMSDLVTGSAIYSGGSNLNIKGNKVTTRYIVPQEIGVVYRVSNNESVSRPVADASGWIRKSSYSSIDVNETETFDISIPITSNEGYTYYSAYVKTSNGYWYGDIKKFRNNVQGDIGGPNLYSIVANVIDEENVYIPFNFKSNSDIVESSSMSVLEVRKNGVIDNITTPTNFFIFNNNKNGYMTFEHLDKNTKYEIDFRIFDVNGLKSNIVTIEFNTSDYRKIVLSNKSSLGNNSYSYNLSFPTDNYSLSVVDSAENIGSTLGSITTYQSENRFKIDYVEDINNSYIKVMFHFYFAPGLQSKSFVCSQVIKLY